MMASTFQASPLNDTSSIISSAVSTKSKSSKRRSGVDVQTIASLTSHPFATSSAGKARPSLPPTQSSLAAKNSLSIRLAESAVFLRTNDSTGRNRYNDSRPAFLRGIVELELVKSTRISRIVLELGAKCTTIWPEGTHGKDLTEAHKVFSATETVFSALPERLSSRNPCSELDSSFIAFEEDEPLSPSTPTGGSGWSPAWDVRSIQSRTSGTITPTTRRALSADSSWTRRTLPEPPVPPLPPLLTNPPPYSTATDQIESPIDENPTYVESRISFQTNVHESSHRAPGGRMLRSKPVSRSLTRPLPQPPTSPLPSPPVASGSTSALFSPAQSTEPQSSYSKLTARDPLVSTENIAASLREFLLTSPTQSDEDADQDVSQSSSGGNAYEYAKAHARSHVSSSRPLVSPSVSQTSDTSSHSHPHYTTHSQRQAALQGEEQEEVPRGRKRSRFSLASLGNKFVRAFSKSKSRSRSKRPEGSEEKEHSPSRVSTKSGVSAVSGVTTASKSGGHRLPWKRRQRANSQGSAVSGTSGGRVSTRTTDLSEGETSRGTSTDELGYITNTPNTSASTDSIDRHPPPPLSHSSSMASSSRSKSGHRRRPSDSSRSVSVQSTYSSLSAQSAEMLIDSPLSSATGSGFSVPSVPRSPSIISGLSGFSRSSRERERIRDASKERDVEGDGPGWKEFPKGTYQFPILFAIPGHAPPTLDTATSHQKPLNSEGEPTTSEHLPHCTLKWQLRACVNRPGAFASKMQVSREVLVVSTPSEDDGEDGLSGGGENVIVERTWDGGMGSGLTTGNGEATSQFGFPPPPPTSLTNSGADPNATTAPSPTAGLDPPPPFPRALINSSGGSGSLQYLISISGRSFCIGGVIPVEITLMPLDKVKVHRVSVLVEQKIEYYTQFKRVVRTDPVLSIPLITLREEATGGDKLLKDKDKELKHILPLESDAPDALKQSPLWGTMCKAIRARMRDRNREWEGDEAEEEDEVDGNQDGADEDGFGSSDEDGVDIGDSDPELDSSDDHSRQHHPHIHRQPNSPVSTAISELASSLMGPGPWTLPLSLRLPFTHSANLTPEQVIEHQKQVDERAHLVQQQEWGLAPKRGKDLKKIPDLVDVGRGLIPSNKNKRSNVTVSHTLKCVIRVEKADSDESAEADELEPLSPVSPGGGRLADVDESGWDDDWERNQAVGGGGKKVKILEPRKPKPKKKRKLFDIVVQTPIQILSCRCNPEYASLPGYTAEDCGPLTSTSQSQLELSSGSSPSASALGAPQPLISDCCCVIKARVKQARRKARLNSRQQRREAMKEKTEMERERDRIEKAKSRRRKGVIGLSSPPTAPLPPTPSVIPSTPSSLLQMSLSQSTQTRLRSDQRMSYSSGSTSYTSTSATSSTPGSILMNNLGNSRRSSGLSGLSFGGVITTTAKPKSERRMTADSQLSQLSPALARIANYGLGLPDSSGLRVIQSSHEFEHLVAGHLDVAGEAPPTYDDVRRL